jgi:hypothetical protein
MHSYEMTPTPTRAFPAVKTPLPIDPERPAGALVMAESLPEQVEAMSLENGEALLALSARLGRLERRLGAAE